METSGERVILRPKRARRSCDSGEAWTWKKWDLESEPHCLAGASVSVPSVCVCHLPDSGSEMRTLTSLRVESTQIVRNVGQSKGGAGAAEKGEAAEELSDSSASRRHRGL